jgi:hypothetical protein
MYLGKTIVVSDDCEYKVKVIVIVKKNNAIYFFKIILLN